LTRFVQLDWLFHSSRFTDVLRKQRESVSHISHTTLERSERPWRLNGEDTEQMNLKHFVYKLFIDRQRNILYKQQYFLNV